MLFRSGFGGPGGGGGGGNVPKEIKDAQGNVVPPDFEAQKFEFIVQFAWKPGELANATGPAAAAAAPPPMPASSMEPESN